MSVVMGAIAGATAGLGIKAGYNYLTGRPAVYLTEAFSQAGMPMLAGAVVGGTLGFVSRLAGEKRRETVRKHDLEEDPKLDQIYATKKDLKYVLRELAHVKRMAQQAQATAFIG